jgi:hypothetical protein
MLHMDSYYIYKHIDELNNYLNECSYVLYH